MEDLVKIDDSQVVTDSRNVAKHFEKQHKDVLESIRGILAAEFSATKFFYATTYENRGKPYIMYLMNRDGFSLLAMGFTGKKAIEWKIKYINAFNAMEKQIIKSRTDSYMIKDPIARAKKWIEEETERQKLRKANKEMLPKAEFYDAVASTESLFSMSDVAKILDMEVGRNKLFKFLRDRQILDSYNHPYQRYINAGYFKLVENTSKVGDKQVVFATTYVKQKGIDYIRKLLKKNTLIAINNPFCLVKHPRILSTKE